MSSTSNPATSQQQENLLQSKIASVLTFPFPLDPFQSISISHLLSSRSVFVAAHTSAGKTAIASFAIALSLSRAQRLIYTSPIKALSNQKYKDFKDEFGDVGLITGDIHINPSASILVCTTEILRNMLYKGSELLEEAHMVVFDEVHYMRDRERGTVWEESIILLKEKCLLFLSATLSNAQEFSDWVSMLQNRECQLVSTEKRPVPLEYYVYSNNKLNRYNSVKEIETCSFREKAKVNRELSSLLNLLLKKEKGPVLVFRFSRRECDEGASSFLNIIGESENRDIIREVFDSATRSLDAEFIKSESYLTLRQLLERGIGVHHSGLVPVLKEVVELLFGENLLRVLFATETFAMGVNMPARSVVFGAVGKWDGEKNRLLSAAEFTQMSGRAGRRGLDRKGVVVILGAGVDKNLFTPPNNNSNRFSVHRLNNYNNYNGNRNNSGGGVVGVEQFGKGLEELIKGSGVPLESSFKLSYNMVLNIARVNSKAPSSIVSSSFKVFQERNKIEKNNKLHNDTVIDNSEYLGVFLEHLGKFEINKNYNILKNDIVWIKNGGFALVLNKYNRFEDDTIIDVAWFPHHFNRSNELSELSEEELSKYLLDIYDDKIKLSFLSFHISLVQCRIASASNSSYNDTRINMDVRAEKQRDNFSFLIKFLFQSLILIPYPKIDKKLKLQKLSAEIVIFSCPSSLQTFSYSFSNISRSHFDFTPNNNKLDTLALFEEELEKRRETLIKLNYLTQNNQLLNKGRVAAEITVIDEILATEALFSGLFCNLSPYSTLVLISVLLTEDYKIKLSQTDSISLLRKANNSNSNTNVGEIEEIVDRFEKLQLIHKKIYISSNKENKESKEELNFYVGYITGAWMRGRSLQEISWNVEGFEGTVGRIIMRVSDVVNEMISASEGIGNWELKKVLEEGSGLLKRGVVFAGSLYM